MYAIGRNFVKQGARRWSSTLAAEGQKIMPLAVTACALVAVAVATPISASACEDMSGVVSMEKLTAEWDTFMDESCRLGEDDDDDDDEDEEEEDEEDEDEESEEKIVEAEETVISETQEDIQDWLKEQMVASEAYSADELLTHFLDEMAQGLEGENTSSLAMIPAYVGIHDKVPFDKSVAVIDAGGTNLRICMASFDQDGKIKLTNTTKREMPGKDKHITPQEFYNTLVDALEPMKDDFEAIGFCFSYPAEITNDFDGRLLKWTKEIKIPELIDTYIGKGLLDALNDRGIEGKRVVILNDTVACLLAGLAQGQTFDASSYIGFILGTGTNTAYVEDNQNIRKLDIDKGSQVINVESGGFAEFQRGSYDLVLDNNSENPDGHVFEKVISGEYMGTLTLKLLQALSDKGLFSNQGTQTLSNMNELSNIHASNFVANNNGEETDLLGTEAFTNADREIIKKVYGSVVDRAALLTAVNICAAVVKSGKGKDPNNPVCVNIDGSTYYKTFQMEEKVQDYLQEMLKERGLHVECIHVDEAPIVGAAIAGLTTFSE